MLLEKTEVRIFWKSALHFISPFTGRGILVEDYKYLYVNFFPFLMKQGGSFLQLMFLVTFTLKTCIGCY